MPLSPHLRTNTHHISHAGSWDNSLVPAWTLQVDEGTAEYPDGHKLESGVDVLHVLARALGDLNVQDL